MKNYLITVTLIFSLIFQTRAIHAQVADNDTLKEIVTEGVLDTNRTKSGYRINEYYIELSDSLFDAYKGKRIEVRGKVLTVKALESNERTQVQGALHDRFFITEPKIRIVYYR